ncbi:hypothetical protein HPB48_023378 [Haemaphysalis longicornis]|uniref:Ras-GAP domain-containing protein n=1 Tax=Haemaphysalis longicornis TaxID=44386 RepID=A0A9J6H7E1_HAELO|nr:hypothetical protein HPB48_023378 [Haemaphysalis longicornis]
MPTQATNNFVESVIYSVYNYGSTPRDEYLLLRLFRFALLEEVGSKLSKPSDILRGNPLVVRMVIGFFRTRGGHNCLEQLLTSLVRDVLEDKDLNIDLNPVDIYKKWVNDLETTSGKPEWAQLRRRRGTGPAAWRSLQDPAHVCAVARDQGPDVRP